MSEAAPHDCPHTERFATALCGSYFVQCSACKETLITIPWFSAESLLKGDLTVLRAESKDREKVAEGPAEVLVPHIREMLLYNERLALIGPHAVIAESQLGDIRNNSLEVQRSYFSELVSEHPRDETLPFALAQVLHELGNDPQANTCYDMAVAVAKRNWLRKLPLFLLPSLVAAFILWQQSFSPWWAIAAACVGPVFWCLIFRNRRRWLPIVGFMQRAEIAAKTDMRAALANR